MECEPTLLKQGSVAADGRPGGQPVVVSLALSPSLSPSFPTPPVPLPPPFQVTLSIRCNQCCCSSRWPVPYLAALLVLALAQPCERPSCLWSAPPPCCPISSTQSLPVNATGKVKKHGELPYGTSLIRAVLITITVSANDRGSGGSNGPIGSLGRILQ